MRGILVKCLAIGSIGIILSSALATEAVSEAKPPVITDSMHQANMAIVNRNQDGVAGDPSTLLPNSNNAIVISGLLATSADFKAGSQTFGFATGLYLDAQANDWTLGHLTLAYDNDFTNGPYIGQTLQTPTVFVEEATLTLANFDRSPFWFSAGRRFLPFGSAAKMSSGMLLPRKLSVSGNLSAVAGYIDPSGFNVDLYTFQSPQPLATESQAEAERHTAPKNINGVGADFGFTRATSTGSADFTIGYINNLNANIFISNNASQIAQGGYLKKVGGIAINAGITQGPVSLAVGFVSALTHFEATDLPTADDSTKGAKPWAYSIESSYKFKVQQYDSKIIIGYQQSGDAVKVSSPYALGGYGMSHYVYTAGYKLYITQNLQATAQYKYGINYPESEGVSGESTHTVGVGLTLLI